MDVKEIKTEVAARPQPPSTTSETTDSAPRRRASELLSGPRVQSAPTDVVHVEAALRERTAGENRARAEINRAISVVNVAAEAASELGKLVESVEGIIEQEEHGDVNVNRRAHLENEAEQLVREIRRRLKSTGSHGLHPLAGDKVKLEVEEKFGRSLEVVLPDHSEDAFGLLTRTPAEKIIATRATVAEARRRIEELRSNIEQARSDVTKISLEADIALQNSEASRSTIRDLDAALELAGSTQGQISGNHEDALLSVRFLQPQALKLLE